MEFRGLQIRLTTGMRTPQIPVLTRAARRGIQGERQTASYEMTQKVFERPVPGLSASIGKSVDPLEETPNESYEVNASTSSLVCNRDVKSVNASMVPRM